MPNLTRWLEILSARLSDEELRTLCFHLQDIGVAYDDLGSREHRGRVRELLAYLERRQKLHLLPQVIESLWPDIVLDEAPPAAAEPAAPLTTGNPFYGRSTTFVGREEELRRALDKLRVGNHCSIVGPPGSGKTDLMNEVIRRLTPMMGWESASTHTIRFRSIQTWRDVREELVQHLGGQQATQLKSLMRSARLKMLALDDVGGMDPGNRGYQIRRGLRGFAEEYSVRLLLTSNDHLSVLFPDNPQRDSPFETLDRLPVTLSPFSPHEGRILIASRLSNSNRAVESFAPLWDMPTHPKLLLERCAVRYEELCHDG